jgi:hypothetical protein
MAQMNEILDENPYRAPQTTSQAGKRKLAPRTWWGVAGAGGMLLAWQIIAYTPLEGWSKYLAIWAMGSVVFLLIALLYRSSLRRM